MTKVDLIGVPYTVGCRAETSFAIDQHRAPAAIRQALDDLMAGFDIPRYFKDYGDLKSDSSVDAVLKGVEEFVGSRSQNVVPFILGGAHTLTLGALRAAKKRFGDVTLVYFDAHPDLMPHPEINYGSSLYYGLKEQLVRPDRLAFLGIRQIEKPEAELIAKEKIWYRDGIDFERLGSAKIAEELFAKFPPPYLLSIDLDSIEPSTCPGVTTPFPGGLWYREVLFLAREICKRPTIYVDIVELSPVNDRNNESARLAALLLQQLSEALSG
jgi:agmatinase